MSPEHGNAMPEIRPAVMAALLKHAIAEGRAFTAFYTDELQRLKTTHFQPPAQEAAA